jgi:hypothetical protein
MPRFMACLALPLLYPVQICTALSGAEKEATVTPLESAISTYWIAIEDASKSAGRLGENMGLGYDIFRESSDGGPLWVVQAATLKEAKEKLDTLARSVPGKYFIRDAATAKIVGRAATNVTEKIEP